MSILIHKHGVLDTLQDMGRYGYQHLGINPGGAMDLVAMQLANILTGNKVSETVIEMHFPAAEMLFEKTALIALAGADFSASINGEQIPILQPVIIQKNAILRFKKRAAGARVYLSVKDGIVADRWLGSTATHLKVSAGGYEGRNLQAGDKILFKKDPYIMIDTPCKILPWRMNTKELYIQDQVRFIAGNEYFLLDENSRKKIEAMPCVISRESDRMGFQLSAEILHVRSAKEMISTAVTRGAIQLLPSGQMIILMADHQTTGGYPVIGHIVSADFSSLAQMQAGEKIMFQQITLAVAEQLLVQQQMNLQQLQNACNFRLADFFSKK